MTTAAHGRCRGEDGGPTATADLGNQYRLPGSRRRFCRYRPTVWFCDADHNRPYDSGGCTDADNCGLLCRRHHRLKTFTTWSWRRGDDGAIEWIDPNGVRWDREPIRYLMPEPDADLGTGSEPTSNAAGLTERGSSVPERASPAVDAPAAAPVLATPDPYTDDPPF